MEGKRINQLKIKLNELKINALLVSNFYNIFYLTGFKTLTTDEREAFVLVTNNNTYLFTDGRYINKNLELRSKNYELRVIEPGKSALFHLQEIVAEENIKTLGIEAEDLRVQELEKFKQTFPAIKFIPTDKLIVRLREIKDKEEIKKISRACQIADDCLRDIIKIIKVGMTEKEIAFRIEMWLKHNGYDLAFDPIVAINQNSAIPHYSTKDGAGKVKKTAIILIDFGAKYQNYLSDITRMVFINPTNEMIKTYNTLLTIQEKTITTLVRPHESCSLIDSSCRKLIINYQLPNFSHSLGHGIGLEIHEYPKLSSLSVDIIADKKTFTIEPGIYIPNKWGIRIEDTVTVVNGKVQVLTKFPKKVVLIPLSSA